jgi:hypothetical protein
MGLKWREVRILAPKTTIPSRVFFTFEGPLIYRLYIVQYGINLYIFNCRLKINHMRKL